MPQKRNPDALELMRARAAAVGSQAAQVKSIIRSMPSGYNRDYQDTKGPLIRGADIVMSMMAVTELTVRKLVVNEDALSAAFGPGIFATDAAIALVAGGMSFRDAYREVGTHPERYPSGNPRQAILNRTSTGTAGNLRLDLSRASLESLVRLNRGREERVHAALEGLAGRRVNILG
jgi:argininosuccinate lyase